MTRPRSPRRSAGPRSGEGPHHGRLRALGSPARPYPVDPRTEGADRLVLARVQRSLSYLKRQQAPSIALGEEVLAAHTAGRAADARALSQRFERFEQSFSADLPAVRAELTALARTSTESTYAQEQRVLRLNLVLFAVALVMGLGLSAAGAKSLVRALRRLVDGAKAIAAGDLAVTVQVTSKDEIGQLAEAFNHMAGGSCAPRSGSRTPSGSTSTPASWPGSSTPRRRTWIRRSAASPPSSSPI